MGLDAMVATSNQTERTMRTGTIKPTLNNTYDLGTSGKKWKNVYVGSKIYVNGTEFDEVSLGGTCFDQNLNTTDNVEFNNVIVDGTDSEAFTVRQNSDGTDIFTVNTSTSTVTVTGDLDITGNMTQTTSSSISISDNFVEKDAQGTQVSDGQEKDFAFNGQDWEETVKATGALKGAKFSRLAQKVVKADGTFGASACIVAVAWSPDNERGAGAVKDSQTKSSSTSSGSTTSVTNKESDSGEGAAGDDDF